MFGFTSNLVIELSAEPSVHRAYIKKDLSETTLDPIVQQLAMAAASRASSCWLRRCVRATLAAKLCATSRVDAIRDGATFHDPRLEAVRRFTGGYRLQAALYSLSATSASCKRPGMTTAPLSQSRLLREPRHSSIPAFH